MPQIIMDIKRGNEVFRALVLSQNKEGTLCLCDSPTRSKLLPKRGQRFKLSPEDDVIAEIVM